MSRYACAVNNRTAGYDYTTAIHSRPHPLGAVIDLGYALTMTGISGIGDLTKIAAVFKIPYHSLVQGIQRTPMSDLAS